MVEAAVKAKARDTTTAEDTLKKTKKCQAVIKGFFANPDKKK